MVEEKKQSNNSDGISIRVIVLRAIMLMRYLLLQWRIILIIGLIGAFLGVMISFFTKTAYDASVTFVLDDGNDASALGQYAGLASMVGFNISEGTGLFKGDNIIELYKTRKMISQTLLSRSESNDTLLIDRYIRIHDLRADWKNNERLRNIRFNLDPSKFSLQHDSIINDIVANIRKKVLKIEKPDPNLSFIKVSVRSLDESFAKDFATSIVGRVNRFYMETKTKKADENVKILQHQADSVRQALNAAIQGVASATDANPNPNMALQLLRVPASKRQVDVQANQAILAELVKNLELAKITIRKETPLIQVVDEPVLPLEKRRLGKVKMAILGAFVLGFLTCLILSFRFIWFKWSSEA